VQIGKVLLVDDEPDIRVIGEMSLRDVGGWEVVLAASGGEAVELAARELPDVIVLDVMMPGMDGPATLAALRSRAETREIPVIFMTAKALEEELLRLRSLGAIGVLNKPFDPLTLPEQMQRLINEGV
jgi:CheY-like chemotaxis protein